MTKIKQELIRDLIPQGMEDLVESWVTGLEVGIRVVNPRRTKAGDFRIPRKGMQPIITLNNSMHPVVFVITLAHELAHYIVWERYGKRARPHGAEWKREFRLLLSQMIKTEVLSVAIRKAIVSCYFRRERIGSGVCVMLFDVLHEGEENGASQQAAKDSFKAAMGRDVEEGERFTLTNGKQFIRGPKLRTRYRCKEVGSGRSFTVHPLAEIVTDPT